MLYLFMSHQESPQIGALFYAKKPRILRREEQIHPGTHKHAFQYKKREVAHLLNWTRELTKA
ncbi:hypothetical protein KDA_68680 [Dictyobacter alpinus]|uniref:Uncharacterized protein n=1 Tax=Dictyobacter alpinus TaxID=2014873 RepID=A0A402BJ12_9CHLR|nr:hypothetical protein KDA_68680 [Dictyobacter alpinus]